MCFFAPARHCRSLSVQSANPIERFIRELNKKSRKVGIPPSPQSWDKAACLAWTKLKSDAYAPTTPKTPNLFTPNT